MIRYQTKRNLAHRATINRSRNHFTSPQGDAIMNTARALNYNPITPQVVVLPFGKGKKRKVS
ncbi:MAG: hypothetical protein PHD48_12330, partial [Alphaproteobacteria bacterium]|nr:hypothetical protein [Alphaproteobacteria bacterium]